MSITENVGSVATGDMKGMLYSTSLALEARV